MTDEKKAAPDKVAALRSICAQFTGTSRDTQRERLRAALHEFPTLSTVEIRDYLDIIYPAGRIRELRHDGLVILTLWTTVVSDSGDRHRVGDYLLVREVVHA